MITGKTGMRRIRIIDAVPDLQLWLNMHPRGDDPNAPLWITPKGGALGCTQSHAICAKTGGLHIKTKTHLLRHSRLTWLAKHMT